MIFLFCFCEVWVSGIITLADWSTRERCRQDFLSNNTPIQTLSAPWVHPWKSGQSRRRGTHCLGALTNSQSVLSAFALCCLLTPSPCTWGMKKKTGNSFFVWFGFCFFNAELSVIWKHSRLFLALTRVIPAGSVVFLHMGAQKSFPRSLRAQQPPAGEGGGGRHQQPHGW